MIALRVLLALLAIGLQRPESRTLPVDIGLNSIKSKIDQMALSPDGCRLAVATNLKWVKVDDKIVKLHEVTVFDTASCKAILNWDAKAPVWSLAFTPDSKQLAVGTATSDKEWRSKGIESTASHVGLILLRDLVTNEERKLICPRHNGCIRSLAFSPDGKLLTSGGANEVGLAGFVGLWEVATGKRVAEWPTYGDYVDHLAYSPDGQLIAACGRDKVISVFDVRVGKLRHALAGHKREIITLAFSADSKKLLTFGEETDERLKWWDMTSGEIVKTMDRIGGSCGVFSSDAKALWVAGGSSIARYDLVSGEKSLTNWQHTGVRLIGISRDGKFVATAGAEPLVRLWDPSNLSEPRRSN